MPSNEQILEVNGIQLCAEVFGDPADSAILLVHAAGHSMINWDEGFVGRLAAGGRYVIRYDRRDAGRSTSCPTAAPDYDLRDQVSDASALLDALGLTSAHVLGMSGGAAIAQLLALDHADKVASLILTCATPGGPGHKTPDLPPMTELLQAIFASEAAEPDWSDRAAVIDYIVEAERPFAGIFDEPAMRVLAGRIVDRTTSVASMLINPFLIDAGQPWRQRLGQITAPTLVFHGTEDPFFPPEHGRALAAEIPGARYIATPHTGHEVFPPAHWDFVIPTILQHTA